MHTRTTNPGYMHDREANTPKKCKAHQKRTSTQTRSNALSYTNPHRDLNSCSGIQAQAPGDTDREHSACRAPRQACVSILFPPQGCARPGAGGLASYQGTQDPAPHLRSIRARLCYSDPSTHGTSQLESEGWLGATHVRTPAPGWAARLKHANTQGLPRRPRPS